MATTSTQQTNGANTLIVSSSLPLSIPLSSTQQLSSAVNTSALAGSQPSLIAANHHLQSPFVQVYPHDFPSLQLFQQQQQMFLQPQATGLTLQQNSIQTANEQQLNQALIKKKSNKQQKIVSKTSNQLQKVANNQQLTSTVLKSNMLPGQFTTQNNQAVVIGQLPNVISNAQTLGTNKKLIESQKNKYVIQNNTITQQSIVSPQFKHQLQSGQHLQLTSQSPLINQTQLIAQPIPQPLAWTSSNHVQVQSSPIIIRQPTHTSTADGQQLFIQNSNAIQAMQGGQFYVNQNPGLMQLVSNPHNNLNNVTAQLATTPSSTPTSNLATVTPQQHTNQLNNSSTAKLKTIRPASSLQNLSTINSQQPNKHVKQVTVSNKIQQGSIDDGHKKLSKKQLQQIEQDKHKFSTKSTQQMNNELIAKNNLQRSESLKSIDSIKSKSENKLKKQQSSSLDDDSSSLSSNSKMNGLNKKDKSEKKIKQKAIVKPIISHYVGGYIIHESSHPFPINITEELNDELEQIKLNNGIDKNQLENNGNKEGKIKIKKSKKSKLKSINNINHMPSTSSSSLVSASSSNKNETNQIEILNKKNTEIPSTSSNEDIVIINSKNNSNDNSLDETNVLNWSVKQVYEYLISQDVSESIAQELSKAQINGRSLLLLTLQMLTKDKFDFKLGPTLSLIKKIEDLKENTNLNDDINSYLPSSGNRNINDWSVKDTKEFILNLSSKEHAEEFEKQEIDGTSLNLISYENIVNHLNLPFGPALVIHSKIEELKKLSAR